MAIPEIDRLQVTDEHTRKPRQERTFSDQEIDQIITSPEFMINGDWRKNDLLSLKQCSREDIEKILKFSLMFERLLTEGKRKECKQFLDEMDLALIFTQESLRTYSKFFKAGTRLGASFLQIPQATQTSSFAKDESLEDAMRTLERQGYQAVITRNKSNDSALAAALAVDIPIINAGSGKRDHPSQALQELYTIRKEVKKNPEDTVVTVLGDLKNGRTVHSLIEELILTGYKNVIAVSPDDFRLPKYMTDHIEQNSISLFESDRLTTEIIKATDVLYVTRVQKEHGIDNHAEIARSYQINASIFDVNKNIKIMHPLPRNEELGTDVDEHEGAIYFDSVENGVYVAMGILYAVLGNY